MGLCNCRDSLERELGRERSHERGRYYGHHHHHTHHHHHYWTTAATGALDGGSSRPRAARAAGDEERRRRLDEIYARYGRRGRRLRTSMAHHSPPLWTTATRGNDSANGDGDGGGGASTTTTTSSPSLPAVNRFGGRYSRVLDGSPREQRAGDGERTSGSTAESGPKRRFILLHQWRNRVGEQRADANKREGAGRAGAAAAASTQSLAGEEDDDVTPELFVCPITQDVMDDPVIAADGYTYERQAIVEWTTRHRRSPMTNDPMPQCFFVANHSLRSAISEWKMRRREG